MDKNKINKGLIIIVLFTVVLAIGFIVLQSIRNAKNMTSNTAALPMNATGYTQQSNTKQAVQQPAPITTTGQNTDTQLDQDAQNIEANLNKLDSEVNNFDAGLNNQSADTPQP